MAGERFAIGLRARTGAADVVVLATGPQLRLVTRARVELAPPDAAFCYHAAAELPLAQAERHLRAALADATARAEAALAPIVAGIARPRAGLVRGKPRPRPLPPLADLLKVHALWHAGEGELYRDALAAACARLDVPVLAIPQPELAAASGLSAAALAAALAALGKAAGPPWKAENKEAATAALIALAATAPSRSR